MNLNCQGFYIQQGIELYSDKSISENLDYYTSLQNAPRYSELESVFYGIGDRVLYTDGKVYEAKNNHQNNPFSTAPPSTDFWTDLENRHFLNLLVRLDQRIHLFISKNLDLTIIIRLLLLMNMVYKTMLI